MDIGTRSTCFLKFMIYQIYRSENVYKTQIREEPILKGFQMDIN